MEFVFEVVLIIVVGLIGVVGNCGIIIMFTNLKQKQLKFHRLMILLSCFDTIYILLSVLIFAIPGLSEGYKWGYHSYIVPLAMPTIQIALTGSVYCTTAIAIERYLTVCRPFLIASNKWSSKRYIIPILIFSIVYNTPRFFDLTTKAVCETQYRMKNNNARDEFKQDSNTTRFGYVTAVNTSSVPIDTSDKIETSEENIPNITNNCDHYIYSVDLTELRQNKYYYFSYIIGLNFMVMGLFPFIILVVCGILILKQLIVYGKKDERILVQNNKIRNNSMRNTRDLENSKNTPKSVASMNLKASQQNVTVSSSDRNQSRQQLSASLDTFKPFTICKRLKANEVMLSRVSLGITFVFIVCHSVRWVPNIYELIERINQKDIQWPSWVESFTCVSHFLTVLNSSVNFYIYYFTRNKITSSRKFFEQIPMHERSRRSTRATQPNCFPMETNNETQHLEDVMATEI